MSIFDADSTPTTEQGAEQQQTSFLEQLVAKKGDQFRDPEAIAKKALHADEYIEQLKTENAQLKTYAELIEGLKKDPKAGLEQIAKPKEEPLHTEPKENTTPEVGDIESQLEALLEKRSAKQRTQTNLQVAEQELQATFGEKAKEVVQTKAQELGMSVDKLAEIAADSPTAFLQLIGAKSSGPRPTVAVPSSVNTEKNTYVEKNSEYYVRKLTENPKLVSDPQFNQEMYAAFARAKQGK